MEEHVCLSLPPWFLQLIPRLSPAESEIAISICDHRTLLWLRIMFPITARGGISTDCISSLFDSREREFRCASARSRSRFFPIRKKKTIGGNWQESNDGTKKLEMNSGKCFEKWWKLCRIIVREKRLTLLSIHNFSSFYQCMGIECNFL